MRGCIAKPNPAFACDTPLWRSSTEELGVCSTSLYWAGREGGNSAIEGVHVQLGAMAGTEGIFHYIAYKLRERWGLLNTKVIFAAVLPGSTSLKSSASQHCRGRVGDFRSTRGPATGAMMCRMGLGQPTQR